MPWLKAVFPFLDLAANQVAFAKALSEAVAPYFEALGVALEGNDRSERILAEELQKVLDQKDRHGHGGPEHGPIRAVPGRTRPSNDCCCRRGRAVAGR